MVVGDELLLRDGRIVPVEAIRHDPFEDTVYNFEVEDLHCYAVGRVSVLIHNSNGIEFPNLLPERLAGELADAAKVGAKPIRFGDPGFNNAVNEGTVKFVVSGSGEVILTPHTVKSIEISHAVLSDGQSVVAAGQAEIASSGGKFFGINLNNHSGHFMPSAESLQIARDAFAKIGIVFP